MTITVVIFSLIGALLIGLLGALIFIVVVVGFALLILLPVLFITTFAAAFIWLWGVGAYFILKWFNKKEIPGIHTSLADGMSLEALANKGEPTEEKKGDHPNGDAEHASSKATNKSSPKEKGNGTPKEGGGGGGGGGGEKKKNVVGGAVSKVPGGNKVNDTTKGVGVDINGDPTKAADVGKVAGKTGDVGKLAGKAGDVGRVKDVAGGVLG